MDTNYVLRKIKEYKNHFDLIEKFGDELDKFIRDTPKKSISEQLKEVKSDIEENKKIGPEVKKFALEIIESRVENFRGIKLY